jgi:DNA-binding MarR family transcriptional regulator
MRKGNVNEREDIAREVIDSLVALITAFERTEYATGKILGQYLAAEEAELMRGLVLSLSEYHALHYIGSRVRGKGDVDLVNGVKLAKSMGMTKGGISKLTAKLRKKKLIELEKLPDNNKEVHYRLTEQGERIFAIHARLHGIADANLADVVNGYTGEEQLMILEFLKKIIAAAEGVLAESGDSVFSII